MTWLSARWNESCWKKFLVIFHLIANFVDLENIYFAKSSLSYKANLRLQNELFAKNDFYSTAIFSKSWTVIFEKTYPRW